MIFKHIIYVYKLNKIQYKLNENSKNNNQKKLEEKGIPVRIPLLSGERLY